MKPQVPVTGKFLDKCAGVKAILNAVLGNNSIDACVRSRYTRHCVSR